MRWRRGGRSENLEDRRAETGGRGRFPFPFPTTQGSRARLPLPLPRGRIGLGGVVLLIALYFLLNGGLGDRGGVSPPGAQVSVPERPQVGAGAAPAEEELLEFVSFVLDDLQATWARLLPGYREAKLVLFRGAVDSGCGQASAAMGPFYCPVDEKVYLDLGFFEALRRRFGAPGDFAQAYVIAHEIGHHVQRLAGIEAEVRRAQRADPGSANELSVRMELQADCLAGIWGHATSQRQLLEEGDAEEGLRAAAAIGDDRIQEMSGEGVQAESFTHGTSEQRVESLRRGLHSGDLEACNDL